MNSFVIRFYFQVSIWAEYNSNFAMRLSLRLQKYIGSELKKKGSIKKLKVETSNTTCTNEQVKDELKVRIGLEIHARILSRTKIFSDANYFDLTNSPTNFNVAYFDAALPGTMPTLNRQCVEAGLLSALALKCKINARSFFERKHYFYSDLPAGYQITQQRCPIAWNGTLIYPIIDTKTNKLTYKSCRIKRVQLEHDSARTLKVDDLNLKLK